MKKIIFYLPSLAPSGGIERIVSEIVNQLSSFYDITILVKDDGDSFYFIKDNVKIESIQNKLNLNMNSRIKRGVSTLNNIVSSVFKLRNYLKSREFDYIYITHPLAQLELLFASIPKNKIIISEHGASNNYNFTYKLIKKLTYKCCNSYCIPTTQDIEYYKAYNFPVVHTPHYKPKLDYSFSNLKNKVVLNIGRFTDDKKQLTLLKIWSEVPGKYKHGWQLHIVGEGELANDLSNFIANYNLQNEVKLLPPISKVEKYYRDASIFALTSRSEGFGMVLLEAIGFGLPLISFNCPSGPKDIINDRNGFLIPLDSEAEYKAKLIDLMNNEQLLASLSNGAKLTAHNWSDYNITTIWKNVFK